MKSDIRKEKHECPYCKEKFRYQLSLEDHIKKEHEVKNPRRKRAINYY